MAPWHQRYALLELTIEEGRLSSSTFTQPCAQCGRPETRKVRTRDGRMVCEYRRNCLKAAVSARPIFGRLGQ